MQDPHCKGGLDFRIYIIYVGRYLGEFSRPTSCETKDGSGCLFEARQAGPDDQAMPCATSKNKSNHGKRMRIAPKVSLTRPAEAS